MSLTAVGSDLGNGASITQVGSSLALNGSNSVGTATLGALDETVSPSGTSNIVSVTFDASSGTL
jgi:hypothetical protein